MEFLIVSLHKREFFLKHPSLELEPAGKNPGDVSTDHGRASFSKMRFMGIL